MAEDPSTLEAWKKQVARTSQGWWRCIAKYWKTIAHRKGRERPEEGRAPADASGPVLRLQLDTGHFPLSLRRRTGRRYSPRTRSSTTRSTSGSSAVPFAVSMASGAWALWVQGLMTARNVVLIPMLGYVYGGHAQPSAHGVLLWGVRQDGVLPCTGRRTRAQARRARRGTSRHLTNDRNAIVEAVLAVAAIVSGGPRPRAGSLVPVPVPRGVRRLHAQVDEPLQVLPAASREVDSTEGDGRERSRVARARWTWRRESRP